eukprot:m.41733 g.41733  ORF g.41733 m.41733 type:complete len:231 (-) comp7020_c0_seq1:63-755(-)
MKRHELYVHALEMFRKYDACLYVRHHPIFPMQPFNVIHSNHSFYWCRRDVVTTTSSSEGATSSNALVFKNGANCTVTEGNIIEKIPDLTGTDEVNGCCTSIDTVISTDDEIVKVRLHVLNTKASNIYFGVVPTSFHERWKALWLKNGWFLNLENGNLSSGQPFFKNINGKVGNGEWVEMTINTKANTISFGVKGTESSVAYMNFLEGDADRHLRVCILLRHDGDRVKATC